MTFGVKAEVDIGSLMESSALSTLLYGSGGSCINRAAGVFMARLFGHVYLHFGSLIWFASGGSHDVHNHD